MSTRVRKRHLSQWNESHFLVAGASLPLLPIVLFDACLLELLSCDLSALSVVALNNRLPGMLVKDMASVQAERAQSVVSILGVLPSSPLS